jgi:hypothetical protein
LLKSSGNLSPMSWTIIKPSLRLSNPYDNFFSSPLQITEGAGHYTA